ncbi:MAG: AAA family ATPase [Candidatus Methanoculleus thermohydrogenotrophicum]|jgi:cell division control protein 6|nr:AAA family ATPase [Candidatus Methanoculleus thermohydrogenotrophicum]NLM82400.1 AAA family ATPase [Candidatus Methanoculleus thermohydrogenotrophicum]
MRRISYLNHDQTLFRDIDVFDPSFVPEHLNHRDAQIQELAFLIGPALRGARPMNAILRGPPGTGKTTTVLRVFAELKETSRRVIPVYINCRQDHTMLAVYQRIAEQLFGHTSPSRHLEDIRDAIAANLRDADAILLVCFDDAEYLIAAGTYNTLLYQILRLYEGWDDVRAPGVIAVTSDLGMHLSAEADGAVRSVFLPCEIFFPPYTRIEVREILTDRVRQGLYPGVVPPGVINLAAGMAGDAGDVRVGIALIRAAALRAEEDGRRRVTKEDLLAVAPGIRSPALEARVAALTPGERALLYRLAERSLSGEEMVSGAVFEEVRDYIAVGKTTYHTRLRRLAAAGIIDLLRAPGGRQVVVLRYTPDDVFAACARAG